MSTLKKVIKKTPVLNRIAPYLNNLLQNTKFPGTGDYWESHYKAGGNSGGGSYKRLAEFKAKIVNDFITEKNLTSAIEFGCGDGNNLSLINYPKYIGLDISPTAVKICINKFKSDISKSFYVYNSLAFLDNQKLFSSELCLSLDVIFHLVEDEIFVKYMNDLFESSKKYVIIYSRDYSEKQVYHQRSRNFSKWVDENQKAFRIIKRIENPYKFDPKDPENTSNAVFVIYEKYQN
jgi:hypothetical protein